MLWLERADTVAALARVSQMATAARCRACWTGSRRRTCVRRERSADDRRVVHLHLTAKGTQGRRQDLAHRRRGHARPSRWIQERRDSALFNGLLRPHARERSARCRSRRNPDAHPRTDVAMTVVLAAALVGLAACGKDRAGPPAAAGGQRDHAQGARVDITDQLPGRTTAYRVAEVRPQVTGIVQKRLFARGQRREGRRAAVPDRSGSYRAALRIGRGRAQARRGAGRDGQAARGAVRAADREPTR